MRKKNEQKYPMPNEPLTVDRIVSRQERRKAALFLAKKARKAMGFPRNRLTLFRDLYYRELSAANRRFIDGKKHSKLVE